MAAPNNKRTQTHAGMGAGASREAADVEAATAAAAAARDGADAELQESLPAARSLPKLLAHHMLAPTRDGQTATHLLVFDAEAEAEDLDVRGGALQRLDEALLLIASQVLNTRGASVEFLLPLSKAAAPPRSSPAAAVTAAAPVSAAATATKTTVLEDLRRLLWRGMVAASGSGPDARADLRGRLLLRCYDVRAELLRNPVTALSLWSFFGRTFPHQSAYTKAVMATYAALYMATDGAAAAAGSCGGGAGGRLGTGDTLDRYEKSLRGLLPLSALCALGSSRATVNIVLADRDTADDLLAFAGTVPDLGRLLSTSTAVTAAPAPAPTTAAPSATETPAAPETTATPTATATAAAEMPSARGKAFRASVMQPDPVPAGGPPVAGAVDGGLALGPWSSVRVWTYKPEAGAGRLTDLLVHDPGMPVLFVACSACLMTLNTLAAHDNVVLYSTEDLAESHAMRVLQTLPAFHGRPPEWLAAWLEAPQYDAPYWNELHACLQTVSTAAAGATSTAAILVLPEAAWPLKMLRGAITRRV